MRQETVLREAQFDPRVVDYWLLSGTIIFCVTIFGIPLGILWYFIGKGFCKRYLARVACILTDRSLIMRMGMLNRVEKTIPLDKITDLATFQGPIMRMMKLHGFRVETAGGAAAATGGYLVQLTGIIDIEGFRDAVLTQRDAREDRRLGAAPAQAPAPAASPATASAAPASSDDLAALIREIRNYAPKPGGPGTSAAPVPPDESVELLRQIRDSLKAIESQGT